MAGGYEQIPGTGGADVEGADPYGYTAQAGNNIFGDLSQNLINQGLGAANQWNAPSSDPNSFMRQYLNDFGGLQGAVTDATSPLSEQLTRQVGDMTREATQNVGSQMAGMGGLRSSGMANLAGAEAGRIAGRAGTDLASQQLGLLNSLGNQAMGGRMNAMANQMQNPMNMMNLQGSFGEPMYVQPQVAAKPSTMDWIMGLLNPLAEAGGAIFGGGG